MRSHATRYRIDVQVGTRFGCDVARMPLRCGAFNDVAGAELIVRRPDHAVVLEEPSSFVTNRSRSFG